MNFLNLFLFFPFLFIHSEIISVDPNIVQSENSFKTMDTALNLTLSNSSLQNITFLLNDSISSYTSMNLQWNITKNISIMYNILTIFIIFFILIYKAPSISFKQLVLMDLK